jgi:hypothetical protein
MECPEFASVMSDGDEQLRPAIFVTLSTHKRHVLSTELFRPTYSTPMKSAHLNRSRLDAARSVRGGEEWSRRSRSATMERMR